MKIYTALLGIGLLSFSTPSSARFEDSQINSGIDWINDYDFSAAFGHLFNPANHIRAETSGYKATVEDGFLVEERLDDAGAPVPIIRDENGHVVVESTDEIRQVFGNPDPFVMALATFATDHDGPLDSQNIAAFQAEFAE